MARNPQDIPPEEFEQMPLKPEGAREIFPLVMHTVSGTGRDGPKDFRPLVEKVLPADIGEPTEEELAAIEAGLDPDVAVVEGETEDDDDPGEAPASRRLKSVPKA